VVARRTFQSFFKLFRFKNEMGSLYKVKKEKKSICCEKCDIKLYKLMTFSFSK